MHIHSFRHYGRREMSDDGGERGEWGGNGEKWWEGVTRDGGLI